MASGTFLSLRFSQRLRLNAYIHTHFGQPRGLRYLRTVPDSNGTPTRDAIKNIAEDSSSESPSTGTRPAATVPLAPLYKFLTHTRYLLTLRSQEGFYRSLLLFRLSISSSGGEDQVDNVTVSATTGKDDADISEEGSSGKVGKTAALEEGGRDVDIPGLQEQMYVMESACPHLGADMSHAEIEECETGPVAVCPWHRYDFDLRTGHSETRLRACTYHVEIRLSDDPTRKESTREARVWLEPPQDGTNWSLVELRPVSEEFADPPPPPDISKLTLSASDAEALNHSSTSSEDEPVVPVDSPPKTLIQWAVLILNTAHPRLKVARTRHAVHLFRTGQLKSVGVKSSSAYGPVPSPPDVPPRESRMQTIDPGHAVKRKSRTAMLHALANIEQWAIDLAWDIIARYGPMHPKLPHQFFSDFTKVALDESKHFTLLCARLTGLGSFYGSLPIHAGLWQSATATSQSLSARLAIIHLVHEARGLDVNPATIEKFRRQGDAESVEVLETIHHDEITHVTAGHRWFTYVCAQEGVEPVARFREEVKVHFYGELKGPFNEEARRTAGMGREYYEGLKGEKDVKAQGHVDGGAQSVGSLGQSVKQEAVGSSAPDLQEVTIEYEGK